MKTYRHRFEDVQQYLHHRAPYLMVDRILEIHHDRILTQSSVKAESFYGQGHFPGAAILPGAMMQEMVTQSAGILLAAEHNPMPDYNTEDPFFNTHALGVLIRVKDARYRTFARPGDLLDIQVQLEEALDSTFQFRGSIHRDEERLMNIHFQLANIPSAVLQGIGQ